MTTAPDHHEPLDPEERDLAGRLVRVGPFEGPSPALDARILAAAHAAAAARTPRPQRRLAWLGLPPALVTGVGVAAAAVLALGLVWQLRPQYGGVITRQEAEPGDEMIIMVDPPAADTPSAGRTAPEATAATDSVPRKQGTAPADTAAAKPAAKMQAPTPASAPASTPAPAPPPVAIAEAGTPAADAGPEETRVAEAAAEDAASVSGFVGEPPATGSSPSTRKSHATYTTAARAAAERRERAAANVAPAAAPQAASPAESTVLDRIEVTGSRVKADIDWSQVPVGDDTGLAPAEWLERIRARRDAGDTEHARASLKLFKREHPRVRVPDDLRALLTADAPR